MIKVYLDCDGVILDTINTSSRIIKEKNIHGEPAVRKFYSSIDWKQLIEDSGQINNAIFKIKELSKHFNIEILTHINSEYEASVKIEYFAKELPGINVITVPKIIQKADFIVPHGAVLVDDFTPNLDYWKEKGGIPVKFSVFEKECDYPVISDLLELINLLNKEKVKE